MDIDSRAREKDAGLCDEMLLKVAEHLIQGPYHQYGLFAEKIQAAIGKYDELLTLVRKWKQRWLNLA